MHIWIHRMQVLEKPADSHAVANTGIRNSALQHLGGINLCSGIITVIFLLQYLNLWPQERAKLPCGRHSSSVLDISRHPSTIPQWYSPNLSFALGNQSDERGRPLQLFNEAGFHREGSIREADRSNNSNRWWVGDKDHGLEGQKVVDSSWEVRKPATVGHFSLSEIREKQDSKQPWMKIMKTD